MLFNQSILEQAQAIFNLNIGTFYFYKKYVICEIKEGIVVNFDNLIELIHIIEKHFGESTPYAIIGHRINAYSIDLSQAEDIIKLFKYVKAYAVVYYSNSAKRNVEFEKYFHNLNYNAFTDLKDAVVWVKKELE